MEQTATTSLTFKVQRRKKRNFKQYGLLTLMMMPGLLYFLVNNYFPMVGLLVAFKDINFSKGIFAGEWVGLSNFEYLFKTTDAYIITRNTLLYNGSFIIINTVMGVAVAIILNEIKNKLSMRFYQSVVLIPYLISTIIISYLVYAMLSTETGFMNKSILSMFHVEGIAWYSESKYWPFILTIVNTWKSVGFLCVIYLASIIGIDPEYYEAATIDGASKFQQIRAITLPLIVPTIITMTLLAIGRIFYSDFGLFYQVPMDSGALYDTTNVIDTYVYRGLMQLGDIGMSAAAGMYQSIVGLILVLLSNIVVRRISRDNSLF